MRPINSSTYSTLVRLLKGTFKQPVRDRSRLEKNALLMFWQRKDKLSLKRIDSADVLFFENKRVVTSESFANMVQKSKTKMKGGGARSAAYKMKGRYEGVSERSVKKVLDRSQSHGHLYKENLRTNLHSNLSKQTV